MEVSAFYGDDLVSLTLPDRTRVLKAPPPLPPLPDYENEVLERLRQPLGCPPLRHMVDAQSRVTIAFDDAVLPLPPMLKDVRGRALQVILKELESAGVERERIDLICAIGLHRKFTPRELRHIVGGSVWSNIDGGRIRNHDAEDASNLVHLKDTPSGYPVVINRAVTDSDLLIYVNVNWTSMNGGWKSILVGLGDFTSIRAHHNPRVLADGGSVMDPSSQFHTVIREQGKTVKEYASIFTVETVLNNRVWGPFMDKLLTLNRPRPLRPFVWAQHLPAGPKRLFSSLLRSAYQPAAVHAGDIDEVHPHTLEVLHRQQNVVLDEQADALFLSLPNLSPYAVFSRINPLLSFNIALGYVFNFFQGRPPVKEGGVLILNHPFLPGFHRRHHPSYIEFYEEVLPRTKDPLEMEELFEEDFAHRPEYIDMYRHNNAYHGIHPFYVWSWASIALKHLNRIIVTGAVDATIPEHMGLDTASGLDEAWGKTAEILGDDFSLLHLSIPPIFCTTP
jgi:hypothetical protein